MIKEAESMTKAEMEQIKTIPSEIDAIKDTLNNPKMEYVNVYYKDYRTGKGIPKSRSEYDYDHKEWNKLKKKLRRKIEILGRLVVKAEKFIETIDDAEMRTILRQYYINGRTQEAIGKQLGYDDSTISKKLDAFWRELSNNSR